MVYLYRGLFLDMAEVSSILYRPTYSSYTSDGHQRETATGGLRTILLNSTVDYRPNDHVWYDKMNLNRNLHFTNEIPILEKKNLTSVTFSTCVYFRTINTAK